jgi:hypothetical protein
MSYRICIRIPSEEIYQNFKDEVKNYHGKVHKCMGLEIQKALEERTRKLKLKKEGLEYEHLKNDDIPDIKKIFEELKLTYPDGGKASKRQLTAIIMKATGYSNHQTINNKILLLEAENYIDKMPNDKFLIFPDLIKGDKFVIEDIGQLDIPTRFEEKIKVNRATAFASYDLSIEKGTYFRIGKRRFMIHTVEPTTLGGLETGYLELLGYTDKYKLKRDWKISYRERKISAFDKLNVYVFEEE